MKRQLLWPVLTFALIGYCSGVTGKALTEYGIVPEAIERVEILYFPERVLTRAAFTPERLEQLYQYKIEIKDFTACTERQHFIAIVRSGSALPSYGSHDVRTAVLLYGKNGKRVLSVYFDRSGKNGFVNSESVSIDQGVYSWAKSMMRGFAD